MSYLNSNIKLKMKDSTGSGVSRKKLLKTAKSNILEIAPKLWHRRKLFTAGVKLKLVSVATLTNCC